MVVLEGLNLFLTRSSQVGTMNDGTGTIMDCSQARSRRIQDNRRSVWNSYMCLLRESRRPSPLELGRCCDEGHEPYKYASASCDNELEYFSSTQDCFEMGSECVVDDLLWLLL